MEMNRETLGRMLQMRLLGIGIEEVCKAWEQ